jgi:osmotically-inducible protein OsmY
MSVRSISIRLARGEWWSAVVRNTECLKGENMKTTLFVIVIVMACFACNSQALDDSTITARVKAALATDSQTSAIKIGVETNDGVVTLTGKVPTDTEKSKAQELASNENGVKKIVNNINVDPDSIGATNAAQTVDEAKKEVSQTASDDLILAKIKSKLLVAGLSGVSVDVSKGDVILKGKVKNKEEKTEAEDIAKNTNGVKVVKSGLNIGAA